MAKVHKPVKDWCPSLRQVLSAINTPSYKLSKFLVTLLTPITSNDYTIKYSFSFVEEVSSFDYVHSMTSFDIESLVNNISGNYRHFVLRNFTKATLKLTT